jgi:Kef-type K+ transport system membrane component KefB
MKNIRDIIYLIFIGLFFINTLGLIKLKLHDLSWKTVIIVIIIVIIIVDLFWVILILYNNYSISK